MAEAVRDFVNERLLAWDVDAEVYTDYIMQILDGDDIDEAEAREGIEETLEVVEDQEPVPAFIDELLEKWSHVKVKDQKDQEALCQDLVSMAIKQPENEKAVDAPERDQRDIEIKRQLLAQYAIQHEEDIDDEVDEGGEPLVRQTGPKKKKKEDEDAVDFDMIVNNKDRMAALENQMKQQQMAANAAQKAKMDAIKAATKAQKEAKAAGKAAAKSQKQERRR